MTVKEICKHIESFAPLSASLKYDNPGLQIGNDNDQVQKVFICLDLNSETLNEALQKNANLIITHHPLIFEPLNKLNFINPKSNLIKDIIKNNINVYSAHTNLDASKQGISFAAAKLLGLKNIKILKNYSENLIKFTVFTPKEYTDKVLNAVFEAKAGIIGDYKKCSFRTTGIGTFEPEENANPFVGEKKSFNEVSEEKLEFIAYRWDVNNILNAIYNNHPYDEPAIDIIPLNNDNLNYGFGVLGEFEKELSFDEFANLLIDKLKLANFRYTQGQSKNIKKIAYCGGSGSDLLKDAMQNNCDAFVTADVKYHSFQDAENILYLIDAGHYETEFPGVIYLYDLLKNKFESKIQIYLSNKSTNPIKFYK
jgi:dinuclear metal center YbgI/SA1388 family protein